MIEDDDIIDDELMQTIAYSFDDFFTELLQEHSGKFNILDASAIALSRICRYSVEGEYRDEMKSLLITANSSLDMYDEYDGTHTNHTLQ